jgi:hypothetical protein
MADHVMQSVDIMLWLKLVRCTCIILVQATMVIISSKIYGKGKASRQYVIFSSI